MNLDDFDKKRDELMEMLQTSDPFFKDFGLLDDNAFNEGHIPKKYKELCMITTSIVTRCEECATYHIEEALSAQATWPELKEAIIMGLMAGWSLCYPCARHAIAVSRKLLGSK